jgi:hypothetical protein
MTTKPSTLSRAEEEIHAALADRLARASTRQEKTRATASVLFFDFGVYPSAKVVHGYTKHGSMTDINGDLRAFWNDLREKTRVKIEAPMLPAEVTNLFSDGLARIWELAMDKAHAALDGERQESAEQVAQAQRETQEATRMRDVAEDQARASEAELRQERERRELAETRVGAQAAEIDALRSSIATWQAQAESEAKARQAAEEQFSRDLEAERAARQRDTEMFEGEIKFAKMQIEAARATERDLRDQIKEDKSSKEVELAAIRQRANRAEEILGNTRMELAELKGRYEGLVGRFSELQQRVKGMPRGVAKGLGKMVIKRRSLRR